MNVMDNKNLKQWPFIEAKKILKRLKGNPKDNCIFQTGYGPSGLPHIGTFGEVLRTTMVMKAFSFLSEIPTKLFIFSDDMDGLRKVPDNVPNKELIEKNLEKPLSSIPDPFEKFSSFSEHNNNKLKEFLDSFDFQYEFKSATENYKTGIFNNGLEAIFDNYDKILDIILPTLGKERRETYSPFLPICKTTGKVLQVKVLDLDKKNKNIIFVNPNTNKEEQTSIFDGDCKLQWKVDWAMRWLVLEVDYEMNGKDLIESYSLSSRINKIIGGIPPVNFTYELFLDEKGEKISKSVGNGISVEDWLKFSPKESLELFMFQNPNRAKKLFFDVIPKTTDEFLKLSQNFKHSDEESRVNNAIWFINSDNNKQIPENITFNMVLNLASVCNADSSDILWEFIYNYYPELRNEKNDRINELLNYGVNYYKEFILPNKEYRAPNEKEMKGFEMLVEALKKIPSTAQAEDIQTEIYNIGMSLEFENLRDWFSGFYEVILGQKQGPRLGSFIKFFGINKTVELLESKIREN